MVQTQQHLSILQKIFRVFEIAAQVGSVIPEPHVQAIDAVLEVVIGELQGVVMPVSSAQIVQGLTQVPQRVTGDIGTMKAQEPAPTIEVGVVGGTNTDDMKKPAPVTEPARPTSPFEFGAV